jgi:hypothetical protein
MSPATVLRVRDTPSKVISPSHQNQGLRSPLLVHLAPGRITATGRTMTPGVTRMAGVTEEMMMAEVSLAPRVSLPVSVAFAAVALL